MYTSPLRQNFFLSHIFAPITNMKLIRSARNIPIHIPFIPNFVERSIVSGTSKSTCLNKSDAIEIYDFLSGGNICTITIVAPMKHWDSVSRRNEVIPISIISVVAFISPSSIPGASMKMRMTLSSQQRRATRSAKVRSTEVSHARV